MKQPKEKGDWVAGVVGWVIVIFVIGIIALSNGS